MLRAGFRVVVAALLAVTTMAPATGGAETDPAFTVARDDLRAATSCDESLRTGQAARAVLLVHGTGATPQEAWSWNYGIALRRRGYGVCTVRLPKRAFVDLTISAQYVAYAGLRAARLSERKVAIIGHSQGALLSVWAVTWWPTLARQTADVVSLGGPIHGSRLANSLCATGSCATVAWRMRRSSAMVTALNRAAPPRQTAVSSIGTLQDEIVYPQPAASTYEPGATVMVQDVCPGHFAEHGSLVLDAVGFALAMDAVRHAGPAVPGRVDRSVCRQLMLPGTDLTAAAAFASTAASLLLGLANPARWVSAEPRLPAYAR